MASTDTPQVTPASDAYVKSMTLVKKWAETTAASGQRTQSDILTVSLIYMLAAVASELGVPGTPYDIVNGGGVLY